MKRKVSIILVLALTLIASSLCVYADMEYEYNGKEFHVSCYDYFDVGKDGGMIDISTLFSISDTGEYDGHKPYVTYDGKQYYPEGRSVYITLPPFESGKKIALDGFPVPNGYEFAWNNVCSEVLGSEKWGIFSSPRDTYYLCLPIVKKGMKAPFELGSNPGSIEIRELKSGYSYTGKSITPKPVVVEEVWAPFGGMVLKEGVDYTVSYKNNVNVGKGTIIIKGLGIFEGTIEETFSILTPVGSKDSTGSSPSDPSVNKKENTLTVKAKNPSVKASKVKKKKQTIKVAKAFTIKNAQGAVTFKTKGGDKKLTINRTTGAITVKKGTKKGTHKIKVAVTAAGNENYKAITKTVTVKVRVK